MGETAGDAERSISDASASARRRSVEVGLDVGRVAFDFQDDVCGENESCCKNEGSGVRNRVFEGVGDERGDVCIFLLTCGVHREEVVFSQLLFAVEFGDFGADGVSLGVHQTGEGDGSRADTTK